MSTNAGKLAGIRVLRAGSPRAIGRGPRELIGGPIAAALTGCLALVALTLVGPTPEAEAASKSVGCFKQAFPAPGEKPAFRKKPSKCVYIDKGALSLPVPPTSAVQTTKDVRWRSWGGRTAKGRGMGFSGTRDFPIQIRITLSRPVKRCGRKVYSKAKFFFPQTKVEKGPFKLRTC
jgi:hypothetical protein